MIEANTIYFDFDGTLHNTMKIYKSALDDGVKFLKNLGIEPKNLSPETYHTWLGYNAGEMWKKVLPDADDEIRKKVKILVGKKMQENLNEGKGTLYDGVDETLLELKKRNKTLVFLSNARTSYYETVKKVFKLEKYFDDFLTSEAFKEIPKEEIIKRTMKKYKRNYIVVGDRFFDIQGGIKNGLDTIFCNYGFGEKEEGKEASAKIDDIRELLEIIE